MKGGILVWTVLSEKSTECYRCKKRGHIARDCKEQPKPHQDKNGCRKKPYHPKQKEKNNHGDHGRKENNRQGGNRRTGKTQKGKSSVLMARGRSRSHSPATSYSEGKEIEIFLDSAASDHIVENENILNNEVNIMDHPKTIVCANGSEVKVTKKGNVEFETWNDEGKIYQHTITDVLANNKFSSNLLSAGKLVRKGYYIILNDEKDIVKRKSDGVAVLRFPFDGNYWKMTLNVKEGGSKGVALLTSADKKVKRETSRRNRKKRKAENTQVSDLEVEGKNQDGREGK